MATENQPGSETTLPTNNQNAGLDSDLFARVQEQLLGESGILSSEPSNIEAAITQAMGGVETARAKTEARIQSEADRTRGYIVQGADTTATASRASGSGGIMNAAALRQLQSDTSKEIKDLEQRKQEALLANDAQAAQQFSNLMIQKLQFEEQAKQQAFSNMLQLANLNLGQQQENRLARAQSFTERSQVASIGLQYGIQVGPDDTIESVVAKAAPFASAQQQAELARTLAQTREAEARASQIIREGASQGSFDDTTADILASAFRSGNTSFLAGLKTNDQYASVFDKISKQDKEQEEYIKERIPQLAELGNFTSVIQALNEDPNVILSEEQAAKYATEAMAIATEKKKEERKKRMQEISSGLGQYEPRSSFKSSSGYTFELPKPKISTGNANPTDAFRGILGGYFNQ